LSSNETGTNYTLSNVNETEVNSSSLESSQVEPNINSVNNTNSTNILENKGELIGPNEHNIAPQGESLNNNGLNQNQTQFQDRNNETITNTNQTLANKSLNNTDSNLNQTQPRISNSNESNPVSTTTNSTRLNDEGPKESSVLMAIGITAFVLVILSAIAFLGVYVKKKRNGLCNYQRITIH